MMKLKRVALQSFRLCVILGALGSESGLAEQASFVILHSFSLSNATGDGYPSGALVETSPGVFAGTTANGMVYTVDSTGNFTVLQKLSGKNGREPAGSLLGASDGNLYGVTQWGGASGAGTLFRISTSGVLTVVHSFQATLGVSSASPVIEADDGNIYGTAYTTAGSGFPLRGIVYRSSLSGGITVLHTFDPSKGEGSVLTGLIEANDGNFYGATADGGTARLGSVYRMNKQGTLTQLYSFTGTFYDGAAPFGLLQGTDGNLYGVTSAVSLSRNSGTSSAIFKMTLTGTFSLDYLFVNNISGTTASPVIQATDGDFYGGMTDNCSTSGTQTCTGAIFQYNQSVFIPVIAYSFSGGPDGSYPSSSLVQGSDGKLYGTTAFGGSHNAGVAFSVDLGLPKPLPDISRLQPTTGGVGASILIVGKNLLGATSVAFNGSTATFQVIGGNYLKATVPTGATTGPITVVTPNGTGTSVVSFVVH
jgi:uncharacterized repeat protein (TIGR03803 family)